MSCVNKVIIMGRLGADPEMRTRKWQAQDGTDRYTTEIIADRMEMCGSSQNNNNWAQESQGKSAQQKTQPTRDPPSAQAEMEDASGFDDEIPF